MFLQASKNPEALKLLSRVCFGRIVKQTVIKRTIRQFNGFDCEKDSEAFEKKKQLLLK